MIYIVSLLESLSLSLILLLLLFLLFPFSRSLSFSHFILNNAGKAKQLQQERIVVLILFLATFSSLQHVLNACSCKQCGAQ